LRWILRNLVVIIEGTCYWLAGLVLTVLNLRHSSLVGNRTGIHSSDYSGVITQNSQELEDQFSKTIQFNFIVN
jgi:hypothetical protein